MNQEEIIRGKGLDQNSSYVRENAMWEFSEEDYQYLMHSFSSSCIKDKNGIEHPIIVQESINIRMLNELKQIVEKHRDIPTDLLDRNLVYSNISKAWNLVMNERKLRYQVQFEFNSETIKSGSILRIYILDIEAERILNEAYQIMERLANG